MKKQPKKPAKKKTVVKNRTPKKSDKGSWPACFVAALRGSANVRFACGKAGIGRRTAYDLREKDQAFRAAWDEAMEDACDEIESIGRQEARKGNTAMIIFLLKSHRPHVYREHFELKHSGKVAINIVETVVRTRQEARDVLSRVSKASGVPGQ